MVPDGEAATGSDGSAVSMTDVSVLLVDDDEPWARTNARVLARQRSAFDVVTAITFDEAAERYDALDPDCVVCDYQLDAGTGLELLETVRADDPDRPFVLVTGEGSEAVASEAIGRRVTDYVRKSTVADRAEVLARQVERAVRTYRTRRALERERRSKDAMLDIVTATTTRDELARDFCRHLVVERGYAAAWLGTFSPGDGVVPQSVAGAEAYLDAVLPPGTDPDAGDEPALAALDAGAPHVVGAIERGRDAGEGGVDASGGGVDASGGGVDASGGGVDASEGDVAADRPDSAGSEPASAVDPNPADWRTAARDAGFRSAAAVPVSHDGTTVGVLAVYADDPGAIDGSERDLLEAYGSTIGFALRTAEWKQSLLSATPVTAEIAVGGDHPLVLLAGRLPAGATLAVRTAVLCGDGELRYVLDVEGADGAAVEAAAASVDAVQSVTVAAGADAEEADRAAGVERTTATRCDVVVTTPTPEQVLVDAGARFVETTVQGGRATVEVATAGHDSVSELEAALAERYDDVAVASLRPDADAGAETSLDTLTAKQREALSLAFYEGYFERPRRHNATEIAAKLGVSRATFTQHVRAAERKLVTRLLEPGR